MVFYVCFLFILQRANRTHKGAEGTNATTVHCCALSSTTTAGAERYSTNKVAVSVVVVFVSFFSFIA